MALFAIGDPHLSLGADKPMDIFGGRWENYTDKLRDGFSRTLGADDVCVLCGDITWAMTIADAEPDFLWLDSFPGKKLILKGNHDYWWTTASKAHAFFAAKGIKSMDVIHNNCFAYGENAAICGTRGWFYEEETGSEHDRKIMLREIGRLETSLKAAGAREKYVFLHYPPRYGDYECPEILELLEKYEVRVCCSGHIHSQGLKLIRDGTYRGTRFITVSADHVNFKPVRILDQPG